MRTLITGAAGYVGSALTSQLLDANHEVIAFDNLSRGGAALIPFVGHPYFTFVRGDITDFQQTKNAFLKHKPDSVVHLAALVGAPICERNQELAKLINEVGTSNLLRCRNNNQPLIYASTGSVYGKIDGVCDENSPTNPVSVYGRTKLRAEEIVLSYDNTLALRFATGYGVGNSIRMDLLVNDLVRRAINDRCLTIFEADFRRTFIHVRDMAKLIFHFLYNKMARSTRLAYNIFNVGSTKGNTTKRQLAEMIREKTGCTVFYADEGYKDADLRDYEVSYSRLAETGKLPQMTLSQGIDELVNTIPLLDNGL